MKATAKTKPAPLMTGINEAMASIQKDIDAIPKEQRNAQQGFNFRGIDDFYGALHPIFAAHGVVMVPSVLDMSFDRFINAKQNAVHVARVKVQYTFTASDGSKEIAVGVGEAFDMGDKALAKAQSMAQKYVLAQTFQIPTATPDADAYTYDEQTASVPTEDTFAGKSLDQLTILRDEYLEAKQVVPGALLGRIAVMKADAADAIDTTPAPKVTKPAANNKPAKAAATAKPAETKPARTPEPDLVPGGVEEQAAPEAEVDEFAETSEAAPAPDRLKAAFDFVILPTALKHKDYAGRKMSDLDPQEIDILHDKWYLKFQEDIDKTPIKAALRDALLIVKAERDKLKK